MNSRERMNIAMRLGMPARVPVICEIALGHYFHNTDLDEIDIWHDTTSFGEALITLRRRYGFDGILVTLPGPDPDWRRYITRSDEQDGELIIRWKKGWYTV